MKSLTVVKNIMAYFGVVWMFYFCVNTNVFNNPLIRFICSGHYSCYVFDSLKRICSYESSPRESGVKALFTERHSENMDIVSKKTVLGLVLITWKNTCGLLVTCKSPLQNVMLSNITSYKVPQMIIMRC